MLVNDTICTFVGMKIYSYGNKTSKLAGYLAFPGTVLKLDKTLAIFVELYGDTASLAKVPKCKIKLSNFMLNQQKMNPNKIIAIYNRKYPQWANATKNNETINIEIGKHFQRKSYYITESDCNLIFVRWNGCYIKRYDKDFKLIGFSFGTGVKSNKNIPPITYIINLTDND